jgi:hypothetical protein
LIIRDIGENHSGSTKIEKDVLVVTTISLPDPETRPGHNVPLQTLNS